MKTQATAAIVRAALDLVKPQFRLPLHHGEHGIAHWTRVWANAEALCERYQLDPAVACWFAFLHDSQRFTEGRDRGHGIRAAVFARRHVPVTPEFTTRHLWQLEDALTCHSDGHGSDSGAPLIVQVCWDADRLDLGRCGIVPDPERLCTDGAREMITASHARATAGRPFRQPVQRSHGVRAPHLGR